MQTPQYNSIKIKNIPKIKIYQKPLIPMEKKLTAQGPTNRKSYTVTLPIEWVKEQKLDKSKQIDLEVVGNKIVLSPKSQTTLRETIDLSNYPHVPIKVLQGLYRLGVDEIKLLNLKPIQLEQIASILTKLIGYEIIEQKSNYLLIKDITKESSESFDTVLRRIFLLILELSRTPHIHSPQIHILDNNIKKLINYCQRILIKSSYSDYHKIPFYYTLLDQLEKITDEYTWLPSSSLSLSNPTLANINLCLQNAYDIYYKFDAERYDTYTFKTHELRKSLKLTDKSSLAQLHLHNLARLLNSLYGTIFILRYR